MKKIASLVFTFFIGLNSFAQKVEWVDFSNSISFGGNESQSIATDPSGYIYVLSEIDNAIILQGDTINPLYGQSDIMLSKYSPGGFFIWAKVFGGGTFDNAYELAIDSAYNIYASVSIQWGLSNFVDTIYTAPYDRQIIQFDSSGNYKRHLSLNTFRILIAAQSFNIYLAYNATVEKCDTTFNSIWTTTATSTSVFQFDFGSSSISVARNGHLVLTGKEYSTGGSCFMDTVAIHFGPGYQNEIFVMSMDTNGSVYWARALDSTNGTAELNSLSCIDDSGNVYVSLKSNGDAVYFAGDTLMGPSGIGYYALLKYNESAIPQWGIGIYNNTGGINNMVIDDQQNVLLCGTFTGPTAFGNLIINAQAGHSKMFVSKISPSGIVQWITNDKMETNWTKRFNDLCIDLNGNYLATGRYSGNPDFEIGCFTHTGNNTGILTCLISNATEPVPVAGFNLLYESGIAYFENTSENSDTLKWIFGDGQTDNIRRNPSHFYSVPGVYNACLVATNGCGNDTSCKTILVAGIEKVTPNRLANSGYHIVNITGGFPFTSGAIKFIKSGEPDIIPDTIFFISNGLIRANLLLDSVALGDWNCVITSGSFNDTLFNAITTEQLDTTNIEVQVLGARKTLVNTWWPFKIILTNKSNRTEIGIPLYLTISPDAEIRLTYNELNDSSTFAAIDSFGHFRFLNDSIANDSVHFAVLLIAKLSPGESQMVNLMIKIPAIGLRTITARAGNSFFNNQNLIDMDLRSSCNFLPECAQCAMDFLGFVPVAGCVSGAANLGCAIGNGINGGVGGGAMDIIGALAGTVLSCAGPLGVLDEVGNAIAAAAEVGDLAGSVSGVTDDCGGAHGCKPFNPDNWTWPSAASLDPNSKSGPLGLTPENYISGEETMHYYIHFENADTASAPAREVIILDTLDATVFDVSTFRFTSFAFGDSSYTLDVQDNLFTRDIDMRPAKNIILRVTGFLDSITNVVTWKFQSFDTLTYDLTINVNDGFLPPNISRPEGEGYLTYAIEPIQGLQHLQQLKNTATIIFDGNGSVITNTFLNTIDDVKPSSQINANPTFINDTTFILTWSGTDAHAGVNVYDIYVSINNGAYIQLFKGTAKTWARLTGVIGDIYKFYSIATDLADNRELPPSIPDETVTIVGIDELNTENFFNVFPNPSADEFIIKANEKIEAIKIMDVTGREIFNATSASSTIELKPELADGIYFLKMVTANRTGVKKIVVQK